VRHCDPTTLAAVALGDGDTADIEHVALCPVCQREVDALVEVRDLIGQAPVEGLQEPPAHIWSAISDEIAASSAEDSATGIQSADPTEGLAGLKGASAVADLSKRRRARWLSLAAAAVVGGILGAGAMALTSGSSAPERIVASATLEPISGGFAGGTARVADQAGQRELLLTMPEAPSPSGYYEAWLLDPSGGGMIALGTVPTNGGSATLPIPEGVDIAVFSAVDVSDEPFDGNPAHSAISVMRGTFSS